MAIRILLADDHKIVRDGLRSLLEKEADMIVVGEAENGRAAVEAARDLKPDVVVLDIAMPDLNGIEAARQIVTNMASSKILTLSMHSDRRFVTRILNAGATGYLLKDCAFEELVSALRVVVSGQMYLSPVIIGSVIKDYVSRLSDPVSLSSPLLTPRESEVLQLLAEGKTTKVIANQLYVSVKTVETHRQQIMEKLQIHSIAQLTKYAIREGLTSLES